MKRAVYILILLSCLGFKYIHAEQGQTFAFQVFSLLNKSDKTFSEKPSSYNLSTVDSGDSDHNPFSKKRKRGKRAIKPILICVANEPHFIIIAFEIDLVCSPQTYYFFRPYFVHWERGPPAI